MTNSSSSSSDWETMHNTHLHQPSHEPALPLNDAALLKSVVRKINKDELESLKRLIEHKAQERAQTYKDARDRLQAFVNRILALILMVSQLVETVCNQYDINIVSLCQKAGVFPPEPVPSTSVSETATQSFDFEAGIFNLRKCSVLTSELSGMLDEKGNKLKRYITLYMDLKEKIKSTRDEKDKEKEEIARLRATLQSMEARTHRLNYIKNMLQDQVKTLTEKLTDIGSSDNPYDILSSSDSSPSSSSSNSRSGSFSGILPKKFAGMDVKPKCKPKLDVATSQHFHDFVERRKMKERARLIIIQRTFLDELKKRIDTKKVTERKALEKQQKDMVQSIWSDEQKNLGEDLDINQHLFGFWGSSIYEEVDESDPIGFAGSTKVTIPTKTVPGNDDLMSMQDSKESSVPPPKSSSGVAASALLELKKKSPTPDKKRAKRVSRSQSPSVGRRSKRLAYKKLSTGHKHTHTDKAYKRNV